jgi:hypothetical protein
MEQCFEIEDLKKFKDDQKFLDDLEQGINDNIKSKKNNLGLSYIYRNIIHGRENIDKKWAILKGAYTCHMYTSDKYNMRILLIGENHDASRRYPNTSKYDVDVKTFIETQISTATDYVDFFLENNSTYTDMETEDYLRSTYATLGNGNIKDAAMEYYKSATNFDKPYPYLRTHFVDTRYSDPLLIIGYNAIYNLRYKSEDIDTVLKIFETTETRVNYFVDFCKRSKIFKQPENIEDIRLFDEKVLK